jgi:hypothetical protein
MEPIIYTTYLWAMGHQSVVPPAGGGRMGAPTSLARARRLLGAVLLRVRLPRAEAARRQAGSRDRSCSQSI